MHVTSASWYSIVHYRGCGINPTWIS